MSSLSSWPGARFGAPCALTMLFAWCSIAAAQDYAGRETLRAQSNEFRKEVIRVTDGVYAAVGLLRDLPPQQRE